MSNNCEYYVLYCGHACIYEIFFASHDKLTHIAARISKAPAKVLRGGLVEDYEMNWLYQFTVVPFPGRRTASTQNDFMT